MTMTMQPSTDPVDAMAKGMDSVPPPTMVVVKLNSELSSDDLP